MIELAIGLLDRPDDSAWLVLKGADQPRVLIGTEYDPQLGFDGTVEERLDLHLRGSRLGLRQVLEKLESLLRASNSIEEGDLVLRLWSVERGLYLYSRILEGSLSAVTGALSSQQQGSMRCGLNILRESRFFEDEQALPISNSSAGGVTTGLTLNNHDDTNLGHDNWFSVDTASLGLLQSAGLRLEVENSFAGNSLANFWIGGLSTSIDEERPSLNLEAESGTGGLILNAPSASGGKYCQYRWSGTDWSTLASWMIGAVEVTHLRGRSFTPILRFFNLTADERTSLRVELAQDGKVVWQSPVTLLPQGVGYAALGLIQLPLGSLPLINFSFPHQLRLQARHTSSVEHLLEIDDLLLLPHDPSMAYHSISGLPYQGKLMDDARTGASWSLRNGQELKTHHRIGGKPELLPDHEHHFWLFQTEDHGRAPIERTLKIKAWYRRNWSMP